MFVKKLVEKASGSKKVSDGVKAEEVDPHLGFHYGIPAGVAMLAYDPIHKIIALSTKHGQIKLLGKDNTQALLESPAMQPSKFLQFIPSQGVLFNVTVNNVIEVWNLHTNVLSHLHHFTHDITSFHLIPQCFILFIGDSSGNVTVWKFNQDSFHIEKMKYCIPFSASLGYTNDDAVAAPVKYIMPQPTAESKRILLIFADGLMVLWAIQESKAISRTGGSAAKLVPLEIKRATSACWVCPYGSKVVVGFNNGDIILYSVLSTPNAESAASKLGDSCNAQIVHISKLDLGYRLEKIPIVSLKWVFSDGKVNRLYVLGSSDETPTNMIQVVLLDEDYQNQSNKMSLQLPEPCVDIEIISCFDSPVKSKQGFLLLLGKSGRMYAYDDQSIEKYLSQSHKKSLPSLPSEVMIRLPYHAPTTTSAQYFTKYSNVMGSAEEDCMVLAKNFPSLLPSETKQFIPPRFTGFAKAKNLYITGHSDGTIKFWDVTHSLLIPLLSVTHQSEDDSTPSGVAVTAIDFCADSRLLVSGDKSGVVRIYQFMPEPFATENGFFSLTGSSKKGSSHVIHSVKYIKGNGPVLSFSRSSGSNYFAVGCAQGHISLIDIEGPSVLYHKQLETELSSDIISLQFESVKFKGFPKNVLVVATRDSSLLALDVDSGSTVSSGAVHPKKRSAALLMQILSTNKGTSTEDTTQKPQLLLLCSEKAAYIYSLPQAVQGEKKVCYKKTFDSSSCCWASVIWSTSGMGVVLLFSCGKTEIRSLPELSLVKETTLRSFVQSPVKSNSFPPCFVCSSTDGELIMIRSDQEVVVASMLHQEGTYRHLDSLSQVFDKTMIALEEEPTSPSIHQKEKRKGIFGTVFNSKNGSKTIHEAGDETPGFEGLTTIFSVSNFPVQAEDEDNNLTDNDDDDDDLGINDIDLNDDNGLPEGHNLSALLDKQKLASKFQSFKGKLKKMTIKSEKRSVQEVQPHEQPTEKAEAVDQIKKKYGYSSSSESSVAKMVQSKLTDNLKKLQGVSAKTAKMQESASSFSSMAKETLRNVEKSSSPGQA